MPLRPSALHYCAALLASAICVGPAAAAEGRPNVILIMADDLGYMDVGVYNPETFYETPNLDRLAAEGARFTDGYAANPVCSPTRYSIMAGKYPSRIGLTNWLSGKRNARFAGAPLRESMPLEEVTLAEALKSAGYRTAFVGKWHLGPTETFWPQAQGFDRNVAGFSSGSPPGGYFAPYRNPKLTDGPDGEYLTARLGEESCRIIEQFKDGPFLLYLSFYAVHTPLQAPADLVAKYQRKNAELGPREEFADEEQVWPVNQPRKVRVEQNHPVYAGMVEGMDASVGRVLAKLKELGLEENTVVCFTSDNGGLSTSEGSPTSNLPLRGGKGWLYEGGIREPFLIKWPGVTKPGSVCGEPVITTDFYPTILDMAGLEARPDQHRDGVSLVPLLKSADAKLGRKSLFWHYPHYSNQGGFPGGAVRQGDWKLVERYEDGRAHLYNLAEDVGETTDLADAMPERTARMRADLHAWYEEVGARFLEPLPGGTKPWRPGAE